MTNDPGLVDFYAVYEDSWDEIQAATLVLAAAHPQFAPIVASMSDEARRAQSEASRARLRAAMDGDWQPYLDDLLQQGVIYARMGIDFRGWYELIAGFADAIAPRLIERYGDDAPRLAGALKGMQRFLDRAMSTIGTAYLDAKQQEIRDRERDLAITVDSIGDAVVATDAQGHITRMNRVAETLTGWTLEEAAGRPLDEILRLRSEDTGATVASPVERVLREGVVVGLANHTVLLTRDGREIPIADSAAPILGEGEVGLRGVVLVFRDVSFERRLEASRIRAIELEAENRQSQEANRLKSEFLANMSHELRTPLNAIIGFAELLVDGEVGPLEARQTEFIGDILASGRHLLRLINDILDLSKVEAGKMEFHPEAIDLQQQVSDVIGMLRTIAARKQIHVAAAVDPAVTEAILDPSRFKQILYNYVSNALKFTPAGGHVTVRVAPAVGDRIQVDVEDDGIGIPPDDLGRLFTAFQQLEPGSAKKHGGTGLGLALTRRLVEAQDGSVGVTSTAGQGSVFSAVLPRHARHRRISGGELGAASSAPRILVVEDDADDRAEIVATLASAGYAVDTATTVASALHRCGERRYAAITLDLILPDGNGIDLLRAIRAGGLNRDVEVVVVTMVGEPGLVAGFAVQEILPKPLDRDVLLEAIARAGVGARREDCVLVIDDDLRSLKLMETMLQQLGYRAICCDRGEDGLRAADEQRPAVVVLDLLMPEMDGFQFLSELRSRPEHAAVPVFVWSVKDLSADERTRLQRSATAILSKGHGASSLVEALRPLLAHHAPRKASDVG
jgi:PAS domain S-box-containing protein